jgi:hypothetical protein
MLWEVKCLHSPEPLPVQMNTAVSRARRCRNSPPRGLKGEPEGWMVWHPEERLDRT